MVDIDYDQLEKVKLLYLTTKIVNEKKKEEIKSEIKWNTSFQNFYWDHENKFNSFLRKRLGLRGKEIQDFIEEYIQETEFKCGCFVCGKPITIYFRSTNERQTVEEFYDNLEPVCTVEGRIFDTRCEKCRYNYLATCDIIDKKRENETKENKEKKVQWLKELAKNNYSAYLQTFHWSRIKRLKLEETCHICEWCGRDSRNAGKLHIHHKTYIYVGKEDRHLDSLEALCPICHERKHEK